MKIRLLILFLVAAIGYAAGMYFVESTTTPTGSVVYVQLAHTIRELVEVGAGEAAELIKNGSPDISCGNHRCYKTTLRVNTDDYVKSDYFESYDMALESDDMTKVIKKVCEQVKVRQEEMPGWNYFGFSYVKVDYSIVTDTLAGTGYTYSYYRTITSEPVLHICTDE